MILIDAVPVLNLIPVGHPPGTSSDTYYHVVPRNGCGLGHTNKTESDRSPGWASHMSDLPACAWVGSQTSPARLQTDPRARAQRCTTGSTRLLLPGLEPSSPCDLRLSSTVSHLTRGVHLRYVAEGRPWSVFISLHVSGQSSSCRARTHLVVHR